MSKRYALTLVSVVTVLLSACESMTEACTSELGQVVDPTAATIHIGQTLQVGAHGTSCGGKEILALNVHWKSSDSAVIRVGTTGKVTGIAEGSAVVFGVDRSRYAAGPFEVPVEVLE